MINYVHTLLLVLVAAAQLYLSRAEQTWIKHQFKYLMEPAKVECFYQEVKLNALLHVSFQVVKGEDISMYLFDPNKILLNSQVQQASGSHQFQNAPIEGSYEICFDNQHTQLNWKLVSIYILTFHQEVVLEKFKQDKELNESATFAQDASNKISLNLVEIFTHQALSRFRQSRDDYLIEANNSLVVYWSLAQSIIIVCCAVFQVYFIKKLFSVSTKKTNR